GPDHAYWDRSGELPNATAAALAAALTASASNATVVESPPNRGANHECHRGVLPSMLRGERMLLGNVRASLTRDDAQLAIRLLAHGESRELDTAETRLREEGIDSLLDDPRLLPAI